MDKVKQETFSNFNYEIIKSIDERCVDVKCTYKYKDKTQAHYFSYIKSGNKPTSYYISKAKADMDKLVKSKKPATVAKKDHNNSKATFFKRHKKAVIGLTTAVLVAGVAVAATLVTLKLTRTTDPTAVTEEEIDKYLEGPTGNTSHLNPLFVDKVLNESTKNFREKNLKSFETKMLSSMPAINLIDNFLSKSTANLNISGVGETGSVASLLNDTSEFYSNKEFKSKKMYGSYLKGTLLEDKKQTYAAKIHSFDNYIGLTNGSNVSSKSESLTVFKHAPNPSQEGLPFITYADRKYTFDGYSGPNIESAMKIASFATEAESSEAIMEDVTAAASMLTAFSGEVFYLYRDSFRVTEDGSTVFLKVEVDLTEQIAQKYGYGNLSLMGVPIKIKNEVIWSFKNIDKLGWVLDSFACDGILMGILSDGNPIYTDYDGFSYLLAPAYADYNEKGEKLSEPICINKDKGFTKITYGELDKDKSIDDITYTKDIKVSAPIETVKCYYYLGEGQDVFGSNDITLIRRIDDPKFNGYSLFGKVTPDPLCQVGSEIIFVYYPSHKENSSKQEGVVLDYDKLKDYLNKDIFEEGEKYKDPSSEKEFKRIKLKKAGWFTYEIVFDDKVQFSNIIIDFHEGPSPIK